MPALFKNNASALIASSLSTTDTTIVLSAGLGNSFPLPSGSSYFYGTLFDDLGNYEIVKCTARVTDTLTVVRAQDGTNPLEFTAGDGFALRPVAAVLNNFAQLDANNIFTQDLSVAGVLTAVTAPAGTNTTQVATTAFVISNSFPSGTRMTFNQSAAPTGWTKDTSTDNAGFRLVSGTAGSGGSVDFTTAFSSSTAVTVSISSVSGSAGATTLSTPQIPSHSHPVTSYEGPGIPGGARISRTGSLTPAGAQASENTGGGGSHTHPFSFSSGSGTGTVDLAIKYVDLIIAQKN